MPSNIVLGSAVAALDWQESVLDRNLNTPPASPSVGDRYIVAAGGLGDWLGLDGHIVEYNSLGEWTDLTPNEGWACQVEDENLIVVYDGADWAPLGFGYSSDAMVIVQRGVTDIESGANLKAAYTVACALTPGGNALAADNRAVVIVPAGVYDFGSTKITFDTDFVDVIGEGVCRCDRDPAITWVGQPYASAVSALDLSNAIFYWPDTHLVCDTDTEVVLVTCRDVLFKGALLTQQTAANDALKIDNANACDRGRFIDLGFVLPATTDEAILDGTNTEIASYFEQCHTADRLLGDCETLSGECRTCTGSGASFGGITVGAVLSGVFVDCFGGGGIGFSFGASGGTCSGKFIDCIADEDGFSGTGGSIASGSFIRCAAGVNSFGAAGGTSSGVFIDCFGGVGSFSGLGGGPSTTAAIMKRCKSVGRASAIGRWQGEMIDCDIEVITAGRDGVDLEANPLGAGTQVPAAASDTDTIVITGVLCAADYPVGAYVKNTTDGTWHLITAVAEAAGDTTVTTTVCVSEWDVQATVRAYSAPKIINCRLTATAEAIDTDAETPAIIKNLVSDQSWDVTNIINMANVYDQVFWADVRIAGLAVTLGAVAPDLEVFRDTLKLYAFAGAATTEVVHFTIQMPHSYKEGTDVIPHVHWSHKIAAPGINLGVSWKLEYSWANQGDTFGASAEIEAALEWTDTPPAQYESVYTAFPAITGTGKTISSQLICRLYRDIADPQDDFEEDIMLVEFDLHYQMNSPGSKLELVK